MRIFQTTASLRALKFGDWAPVLRMLSMYRSRFALAIVLSLAGIALSVIVPILSQKMRAAVQKSATVAAA